MPVSTFVPATSPGQSERDEIASSVAARLARGQSRESVIHDLVKNGFAEADATTLVGDIANSIDEFKRSPEFKRQKASRGFRHIWIGLAWFIGGSIVTLATFGAASHGGGSHFVAWGAIVIGALESIVGLVTWTSNR